MINSPTGLDAVPLPDWFTPSDMDVVVGWARQNHRHAGNQRFRVLVQQAVPLYLSAKTKQEKTQVISNLVEKVRRDSPEGGFVKQDPHTKKWFEIGNEKACDKAGHAIRRAIKKRIDRKISMSGASRGSNHDDGGKLGSQRLPNVSSYDRIGGELNHDLSTGGSNLPCVEATTPTFLTTANIDVVNDDQHAALLVLPPSAPTSSSTTTMLSGLLAGAAGTASKNNALLGGAFLHQATTASSDLLEQQNRRAALLLQHHHQPVQHQASSLSSSSSTSGHSSLNIHQGEQILPVAAGNGQASSSAAVARRTSPPTGDSPPPPQHHHPTNAMTMAGATSTTATTTFPQAWATTIMMNNHHHHPTLQQRVVRSGASFSSSSSRPSPTTSTTAAVAPSPWPCSSAPGGTTAGRQAVPQKQGEHQEQEEASAVLAPATFADTIKHQIYSSNSGGGAMFPTPTQQLDPSSLLVVGGGRMQHQQGSISPSIAALLQHQQQGRQLHNVQQERQELLQAAGLGASSWWPQEALHQAAAAAAAAQQQQVEGRGFLIQAANTRASTAAARTLQHHEQFEVAGKTMASSSGLLVTPNHNSLSTVNQQANNHSAGRLLVSELIGHSPQHCDEEEPGTRNRGGGGTILPRQGGAAPLPTTTTNSMTLWSGKNRMALVQDRPNQQEEGLAVGTSSNEVLRTRQEPSHQMLPARMSIVTGGPALQHQPPQVNSSSAESKTRSHSCSGTTSGTDDLSIAQQVTN